MTFFDKAWYVKDNGSVGWSGVTPWAATTAKLAGQFIRQLATPTVNNERCFVVIVAGTSGATEPTWVITRGGKTTDGTVTYMECTGMAGPNGDLTNCPQRLNSTGYTQGSVIYDPISGSLQILTTASGNTASSAPTFSATAGVTTNDGSNVWTSIGATSNFTTTVWQYPHARIANTFASNYAVAGNTDYVSNNHAETQSTAMSWTIPGTGISPVLIVCVNDATAPSSTLATTASVTTTGNSGFVSGSTSFNATTSGYVYGLQMSIGSGANAPGMNLSSPLGTTFDTIIWDTCGLHSGGTSGGTILLGNQSGIGSYCELRNCAISFSSTSSVIACYQNNNYIIGGTIAATGSIPAALISVGFGTFGKLTVRDCDLSAITGTLYSTTGNGIFDLYIENCIVHAGVAFASGTDLSYGNSNIHIHNCDSSATNYRYYWRPSSGVIQQETTIVRTGGATNGTTPLSWNMTANSVAGVLQPLQSEEIVIWNDTVGSPLTLMVHAASNTAGLTNADFYPEVEYLQNSTNPLGAIVTTKAPLLSAPTTLTADTTSAWGGSVSNKYQIPITFTPQMKGPIKVRLFQTKPSAPIYVDPKPDLTGATSSRQYFVPGMGYINETSSGAGASMLVHPGMTGGARG